MKKLFDEIRKDNTAKYCFLGAFIFPIFSLGAILIFYGKLPPYIPIFNQLPWGEKRLGISIAIFIPLLINFTIVILNLVSAAFLYKKQPLVSRVLAITSLIVSILVLLFLVRTIGLII